MKNFSEGFGGFDPKEKTNEQSEKIQRHMRRTKKYMKNDLDIENLSDIEERWLRSCVEKTLLDEKNGSKIKNCELEASARWLFDLYGFRYADIPLEYVIENAETGEEIRFKKEEEHLAKNKEKDLKERGESVVLYSQVPRKFKDELFVLRHRAHIP